MRTGLATRADFIEALACESDSSRIEDLKLWLDRLDPHWRNQPKMTFVQAQALWEADQRCSEQDWSIQTATRKGSLAHSRRRLWKWRWLAQLAPRSVLCRYRHVASQAGMCEAMYVGVIPVSVTRAQVKRTETSSSSETLNLSVGKAPTHRATAPAA